MKSLYSVAIHPSGEIIALVKSMKEQLAAAIGWFNSKNSIAHITINEFEADENVLAIVKKQLTAICDVLEPAAVHFEGFGTYPANGAFFISPDEASKMALKAIMKRINDSLRVSAKFKSNDPHLSIARRLTPEKIETAHQLFTTLEMNFVCDSVVIRKFNPEKKQFEVTDTFLFHSNTSAIPVQGSLF